MTDYLPELDSRLLKDIDPILLRPTAPEKFSARSFLANLFSASCANVPKSEMATGGDASKWQGEMDWNKYFDNGMQFTVIRAMINGQVDSQFDRNAGILTDQNRLFLVYGATGYPTLSNSIPYAKAMADIIKGIPYLAIWLDSELAGNLTPYQMRQWNHDFLGELSVQLPDSILEIYTRQSFWDSSVAESDWDKYPLAAARYNTSLTCPWSDGYFKYRDWDDWRYWQDSQWWDGKKFGAQSTYIDHDYFNGTLDDFKRTYNKLEPPVPDCCDKVDQLEQEVIDLSAKVAQLAKDFDNHTHDDVPPTDKDYVIVQIREQHKSHYYINTDDTGKPIMLTDDTKPALEKGKTFQCQKNLAISSADNFDTPTTIASGGRKYFRIIEDGLYKGRFIRQDKSMMI